MVNVPPPPITPTAPPPYWPPPTPGPSYSPPPAPGPPGNHNTVYIAVFVSLGGAFFLAFLAAGLFCLAKQRKKKVIIPPPIEESACVAVEEQRHVHETITTGPCGEQTVTLTVDDDVRVHEIAEVGVAAIASPHASHGHAEGHHLKTG
ncbi:putative actin binding protein [Corchorus capsularis]|uniref:Putative actin binding protein n=1 Tax=Corchorus capsularis TaxID=210143 RepID=A0A1R3HFV9_COCAP|nr:putative actin binding protein [Corchorus capsularis]